MRQVKVVLLGIMVVFLMASCKSLRKITSKDNGTARPVAVKKHNRKFMDGIEVTPGTVVTSKHKISASKHKASQTDVSLTNPYPGLNANLEKADFLQLKYAIILDATVEKLTNLSLLQKMDEWWGTKYCLGGSTKNCIDCSAFTQTILRDVYNVPLPRTAQEQYNMAEKIDDADLKEADLVFFHTGGRRSREISHVGVYIANNKFANASTSGGVTISDLNDPYWKSRYKGAGRVLK
ncbi:MAG: C40 family peptidase [Bacteroidota bacterium]|nr:C40 family peptidase [Bacteroidota bacterium]